MTDRIVFFPGLGADARLLDRQQNLPARLEIPPWIEPLARESLSAYARRMAGTFDHTTPFFLGGVSFGGAVALEVARHIPAKGVILISSCRSCHAIPPVGRWLGRCARFAPLPLIRPMKRIPGIARSLFGGTTAADTEIFNSMLDDASPRSLRWSVEAILTWSAQPIQTPIFHIHGARDRVIPLKRVQPDYVIPSAGHLMNLTHADGVNAAIAQWMRVINKAASQ